MFNNSANIEQYSICSTKILNFFQKNIFDMERKIDRFDKYMKVKGLNDNKVTVQLSLSVGLIGKSRGKGRDLSDSVVEKILNYYADLNKNWLLIGEGNMLNDTNITTNNQVESDDSLVGAYRTIIETQKLVIESQKHQIILLEEKVSDLEGRLVK